VNGEDSGAAAEHCLECGAAIPPGATGCPACASRGVAGPSRQTATLLSLILLVALFVFTGFATQAFHRHEDVLADEWMNRGKEAMASGHANEAVDAFRTALVYSKGNREGQLRLAQALAGEGRDEEARAYLSTLWENEPGNAAVNLDLARLAAHRGEVAEAVRYYQQSVYGVWESNVLEHRRQTRLELIRYLNSRGLKQQVLAEIIAFAASLPPDAGLETQAGNLFLEQGSYDRALSEFRDALRLDPQNAGALSGAGRASFQVGNFLDAVLYLQQAGRGGRNDQEAANLLELSRAVLSLDPYAQGLSAEARAARVMHDFALAEERLASCTPPGGDASGARLSDLSQRMAAMKPKVQSNALRHDFDLFDSVAELALDVEVRAAQACGRGSVEHQALVLIANARSGVTQ
jgi:tetratricopeptide (TPR) repeat protein